MKTMNRVACVTMLSAGLFGLSQQAMALGSDQLFIYGGSYGNVVIDVPDWDGVSTPSLLTTEAAIFGSLSPLAATLGNPTVAQLITSGFKIAALVEPNGAPFDAEPTVATNYGAVSDLIVEYADGRSQPTIAMFSNANPIFSDPNMAATLNTLDVSHFYTETGDFVDVSASLGNNPGSVKAYSDLPVPGAVWLFGSALGLLGLRRKLS